MIAVSDQELRVQLIQGDRTDFVVTLNSSADQPKEDAPAAAPIGVDQADPTKPSAADSHGGPRRGTVTLGQSSGSDQSPRGIHRSHEAHDFGPTLLVSLDRTARVVDISRKSCIFLGYHESELLGQAWISIAIPPANRNQVADIFTQIISGTGERFTFVEGRVITRGGDLRTILWHNTVLHDDAGTVIGTLSSGQDITDQRSAELRLREQETRLRDLIEAVGDWVWETDCEAVYTFCSPRIKDLLGYQPEDLRGRTPFEFMAPGEAARVRPVWLASAHQGKPLTGLEVACIRADGAVVVLEVSGVPILSQSGRLLGFRGVARDVTERVRTREALHVANDDLERRVRDRTRALEREVEERRRAEGELRAAKDLAEAANRAKGAFLATMSHELRTPLNAIIGFSDAICDRELGIAAYGKLDDYARRINDAGRQLLATINDILDLSAIESGTLEIHFDLVNLSDIAEGCLDAIESTARRHGVQLEAHIPKDLPLVWADGRRFTQIISNLLSNAVKFTGRGGLVRLEMGLRTDGSLELQVTDTGIGMEPTDIAQALKPFGQLDSSLSRRYQGSGTGLPLIKGLVDSHEGQLTIRSKPGNGTVAIVRLPPHRTVV